MFLFKSLPVLFCLILRPGGGILAQAANWRADSTADRAVILDGEDTVAVYRITPRGRPDGGYERANYLHPVYAPDSGLLTEDFPADHLHHRGIFWVWHQVYAGELRAGDGWECSNFFWDVSDVRTERRGRRLVLSAAVIWRSRLGEDEEPVALARERVRIVFHPVRAGKRRIDFRIDILPLVNDLSIGGSADAKGYGGFSWRLPLPADVAFFAGDAELQPTETALAAGRKLRIAGTFSGGFRQLTLRQVGQPGGVYPWILRKQGSMQNVAFPGRELFPVPAAGLRLRYRVRL